MCRWLRSTPLLSLLPLLSLTSGCPGAEEVDASVQPTDAAWPDTIRSDVSVDSATNADAGAGDHPATDRDVADGTGPDLAAPDTATADTAGPPAEDECVGWQAAHPEWIFCDDFESGDPLVADGRYFEYGDNDGDCIVIDDVGLDSSSGLRVRWQAGEVGAGGVKLGFGRNPAGYMNKGIREDEDFREIWYRQYLRMQPGWVGNPAKLSRATVIAVSDWSQAMIAHLWSDGDDHLLLDPASCVNASGNVICSGYNDFDHLDWLGYQPGTTPIFATSHAGVWYCVEHHVRLNDPGQANGLQEFWIDGNLEGRRDGLDFVGTYQDYAINAVFFENYWNDGSIQDQERYFDNIVVSTEPIGCL